MLKYIHNFFIKNEIKYWLHFGTLLGVPTTRLIYHGMILMFSLMFRLKICYLKTPLKYDELLQFYMKIVYYYILMNSSIHHIILLHIQSNNIILK